VKDFYDRRAPTFEQIYHRDDPARQTELKEISEAMRTTLRDRRVLEVACGTGYWSRELTTAASIVGIDYSSAMLEEARLKNLAHVTFIQGDAYSLSAIPGAFDGGLVNFWLSHIPRKRLDEFLSGFHARIGPDAPVFMADNTFVPALEREPSPRTGEDAWWVRRLPDGSTHEILKNYFSEEDLRAILARHSRDLQIRRGTYYWWISYRAVSESTR
jgi:SAM-dependent methyltransferase